MSFGIRPLCPTPRAQLVREGADGDRDSDVLWGEKGELVFPVETPKRSPCWSAVERDVVENVISREAVSLNKLDAMRKPGESYSDVILRLVELGGAL